MDQVGLDNGQVPDDLAPRSVATPRRQPLHLDAAAYRVLFDRLGPSLAIWRAPPRSPRCGSRSAQSFPQPILDLGCGDGLVTSLVLPHVEIALDPDRQALGEAARLGVYERSRPA